MFCLVNSLIHPPLFTCLSPFLNPSPPYNLPFSLLVGCALGSGLTPVAFLELDYHPIGNWKQPTPSPQKFRIQNLSSILFWQDVAVEIVVEGYKS